MMKRLRRLWQWLFSKPTCCECGTTISEPLLVWLDRKGPHDWVCMSCAEKLDYDHYIPTLRS